VRKTHDTYQPGGVACGERDDVGAGDDEPALLHCSLVDVVDELERGGAERLVGGGYTFSETPAVLLSSSTE
jgi:hypothetical protein